MPTRRDFVSCSTVAFIGGTLGRPVAAWQQAPPQPQPPPPAPVTPVFTAIRRNAGFFTGRGGTIGYLIDPSGVVVVDSQFPDSAKLCLDGLNERSKNRAVDVLLNTHHHDDHTLGNVVFKGTVKSIVAQIKAAEHMKSRPGRGAAASEQLFPTATFTDQWRQQIGDEWVRARHYGNAHTSGDAVITFELANVAHMGDLMFNRRQPVVDRPAGASFKNWIAVLEKAAADHANDTIYIFGHAGTGQPVTGNRADVMVMRDFLTGLLTFVQAEIKAGKTKEQLTATKSPVPGFDSHGPASPAVLSVAFDELSGV
jgi:glyoxylase-like metal-dependent hydrolase (beta-lactamase superfamily II)